MKGRVIALGSIDDSLAAALVVDGIVEDLIVDPSDDRPQPGTIYRAIADRPMKGQGGITLRLDEGRGFFRGSQALSPGQKLLVQVTSVPEPGKAVPVTDKLLIKGRAAIVTPLAPGLNISRRIRDDDTRIRLHDIASQAMGQRGWGVIVRSSAAELADDDIAGELAELIELTARILDDQGQDAERLADGPNAHEWAWREWSVPAPDAIEDDADAFDRLGVIDTLEASRGPKEVLAGGATIYVEPTRALVAVDVNTGPDTSPAAALKANLAAARALPRALRLRGLGGQVAIDFAPITKRDRAQIEQALRSAFRGDQIETALVGWTPLGHFELQRKRERFPLNEISF